MIESPQYNAIDFSSGFNRTSPFFDAQLQRKKGLLSTATAYLSFLFTPDTMPGAAPEGTLTFTTDSGTVDAILSHHITTLTTGFIYFFVFSSFVARGEGHLMLQIAGYDDICFSEKFEFVDTADLIDRNIKTLVASNSDDTHGYISTYPTCGFFEVSELNSDVFGVEKVEYAYSYGRKKILNAENFIKKRLTFLGLSMYRQNLLKWLCNCETLTIDGITYQLVSDFAEKNKDENNEICDLQADFITSASQPFFKPTSAEMPGPINPINLFM